MKLDYNGLYTFRYLAKGEGQLHVYDKTPLIFILDIRDNNILGCNLHWIKNKDHRLEFFNSVLEIMDKTHTVGKKKERMRLTYQLLQKPKFRSGLQAIRMYYFRGVTRLSNIPETRWTSIMGKYSRAHYRARFVYKKNEYKD